MLLTERCSARCVHCDIWRNRGVEHGPSQDDWIKVVDDVRRWLGPIHVVFTGGEALLKPFTIDLVRHASSLGLQVEVLTHGYWKDQSIIESLVRANPWRITVSLDGVGHYHDVTRGRAGFFVRTENSLATIVKVRDSAQLLVKLRLKTVIMRHNLEGLSEVARYAASLGGDVLYQPIEQNYNTTEDPNWIDSSVNWPDDIDATVTAVEALADLKSSGLPISNTTLDLERICAYFRDPDRYRVRIQNHDFSAVCAALGNLQIQANGDVKACIYQPAIGNIRDARLPDLWRKRQPVWAGDCCLQGRMSATEREDSLSR